MAWPLVGLHVADSDRARNLKRPRNLVSPDTNLRHHLQGHIPRLRRALFVPSPLVGEGQGEGDSSIDSLSQILQIAFREADRTSPNQEGAPTKDRLVPTPVFHI